MPVPDIVYVPATIVEVKDFFGEADLKQFMSE